MTRKLAVCERTNELRTERSQRLSADVRMQG